MSIKDIFPIDKWDFKSQSILSQLPELDASLLINVQNEATYKANEVIFREGMLPSGIFYIKEGKVKKYKAVEGSGEHIIYVAKAGEFIGYHAILSEERYPDSAATLEDSVLVFIPKEEFLTVLERSPLLMARLLKLLSHEFTVMANGLALFAKRSVRERLALQLVVLREKYKVGFPAGVPIQINLSREDLANLVGTTREGVVRILSEFKEEGIVATKGRGIVVLDVKMLINIANFK